MKVLIKKPLRNYKRVDLRDKKRKITNAMFKNIKEKF